MKARARGTSRRRGPASIVLLVFAALGLLGLLAACGEDAADPTPTTAPGAAVDEATPTPIPSDIAAGIQATATPTPAGEKPVYGGVLNYPGGTPRGLDVWHAAAGGGLYTGAMLYHSSPIQQYYPYDPSVGVKFEAGLAVEWNVQDDGSWLLKLREGVTWHDGEAFNADDMVATFERMLDEDVLIFQKYVPMRNVFSAITKVDDYTVVIHTGGKTNATALAYLSSFLLPISPEHLITGPDPMSDDVEKRWTWVGPETTGTLTVGTGPFRMVHWEPDVEIVAERFENYFLFDEFGQRLPYLDAWVSTSVPDATRKLGRFTAGVEDYTLGRGAGFHPDKAVELCKGTRDEKCFTMEFPHGYFMMINNPKSTEAFKDARINKASRYAGNMDEIAILAYGGRQGYMIMDRGRFPDSTINVDEQYELLPWTIPARRDEFVQTAKDLLAEAGYPDGIELPFPIFSGGLCSGSFLDQYSRMVDAYTEVGLRGFLECREGVIANDELQAGRFSMNGPGNSINLVNPADGIIKYHLLDSWMVGGGPWRYDGQEEIDAMYRAAVTTADYTMRMAQYRDIERWMADPEWTVYPTMYTTVSMAVHGCVRNFHPGGSWNSHKFAHIRTWIEPGSDCTDANSPYLESKGYD
jgi:peptide/nickel transport system substrate-binding protein